MNYQPLGASGSGKSTLAKAIAEDFNEGKSRILSTDQFFMVRTRYERTVENSTAVDSIVKEEYQFDKVRRRQDDSSLSFKEETVGSTCVE